MTTNIVKTICRGLAAHHRRAFEDVAVSGTDLENENEDDYPTDKAWL